MKIITWFRLACVCAAMVAGGLMADAQAEATKVLTAATNALTVATKALP